MLLIMLFDNRFLQNERSLPVNEWQKSRSFCSVECFGQELKGKAEDCSFLYVKVGQKPIFEFR